MYTAQELDTLLEMGIIEDYQLTREQRAAVNAYRAGEDARIDAEAEAAFEAQMAALR